MGDVLTFERARRREAPRPGGKPSKGEVAFFNRRELHKILQLYSRKVMAGEWRDYAIGGGPRRAVFAVYGHASAMPLFQIAKWPHAAKERARYQVSSGDRVLETQSTLDAVLRFLDRRRPKLVDQI